MFAFVPMLGFSAQAAPYTWAVTSGTADWSIAANWLGSPPAGGPSSAGDVDTISSGITGDATINLFQTGDTGTATKSVGILNLGVTTGTDTLRSLPGRAAARLF